jgi:hypothetical protein
MLSCVIFLPVICPVRIESLSENFKVRFSDFHSYATIICIFENPFSIEVSDAPDSSFNQEVLITFYTSFLVSWFSELCKLA